MATDPNPRPDELPPAAAQSSTHAAPPPPHSAHPAPSPPPVASSPPPASAPPPAPGTQEFPPPPVDGKSFYGYLYHQDKTVTPLLHALLRAIGQYVIANIGDVNRPVLDKGKLAAFYKEVGGDYDSLFLHAPNKSISYIWQALGIQHSLQQPAGNVYEEPTIPALTLNGWVRWESLQILLGPEEHVPFVQYAARNWPLKHPVTGEPFPPDLPTDAFPLACDPMIDEWHRKCAERLKKEATPKDEEVPGPRSSDPRVHFNHVRSGGQQKSSTPRRGPAMEYFDRERPIPFSHISSRPSSYRASQSPGKRRGGSGDDSPNGATGRRDWDDDYAPPAPEQIRSPSMEKIRVPSREKMRASSQEKMRVPSREKVRSPRLDPRPRPSPVRHHSQPRHYSSPSDLEEEVPLTSTRPKPRTKERPPLHASVRIVPPDAPPASNPVSTRSHRAELRADDLRRRSLPNEPKGSFGFREKLRSYLPGSSSPRSGSREGRGGARVQAEPPPSSRLRHRDYVIESCSSESDSDGSHRSRSRRARERERFHRQERDRERERELEEDQERRSRRDRAYTHRPNVVRRTSSATDMGRHVRSHGHGDRDPRESRSRDRDWDSRRGVLTSDERGRDERDRRGKYRTSRELSPPVVVQQGVGGRKYPDVLRP